MIARADGSLKRCNQTELFEDNQRDLERAVEQLSELLESPIDPVSIPELRTNVTNMAVSSPRLASSVC